MWWRKTKDELPPEGHMVEALFALPDTVLTGWQSMEVFRIRVEGKDIWDSPLMILLQRECTTPVYWRPLHDRPEYPSREELYNLAPWLKELDDTDRARVFLCRHSAGGLRRCARLRACYEGRVCSAMKMLDHTQGGPADGWAMCFKIEGQFFLLEAGGRAHNKDESANDAEFGEDGK